MAHESNWVFVRGLVRESRHWHDFPEKLQENLPNTHFYFVDLPGNGMNFDKRSPISVKAIMEQVRSQYLRRGVNRQWPTYVIAISLGAMVAVEWAATYPEELKGVVLMNTSFSSLSPVYKRFRPQALVKGLQIVTSGDVVRREQLLLELTTNLKMNVGELAGQWASYSREYPVSVQNLFRQLFAAAKYRLPKKRPQLPMLVLTGERDRLVDPSCSHQLVNLWKTDHQYHPTAGHDLTLDVPQWTVDQVMNWLEKRFPEFTQQSDHSELHG